MDALLAEYGYHRLTKAVKRCIMSGERCLVLVIRSHCEESQLCGFISSLREATLSSLEPCKSAKVIIATEEDASKFIKATSLNIGVDSFLCWTECFAEGKFFVAPLCDRTRPYVVLSSIWYSSLNYDPQDLRGYFLAFLALIPSGSLLPAKQGEALPLCDAVPRTGIQRLKLQTFLNDVLLRDDDAHIVVVFVTAKCPVCPVAVRLVNETLRLSKGFNDTGLKCQVCCPLKFAAFEYDIEKNSIVSHPENTAEEAAAACDVTSVPLIRLYPARKRQHHSDFRGPKEIHSFGKFLRECLDLCDECPLSVRETRSNDVCIEEPPSCAEACDNCTNKRCHFSGGVKRSRSSGG